MTSMQVALLGCWLKEDRADHWYKEGPATYMSLVAGWRLEGKPWYDPWLHKSPSAVIKKQMKHGKADF